MKISYDFDQKFELIEIDMSSKQLFFKTNDGMNEFENSYLDFTKDDNGYVTFSVDFKDIRDLNNIVSLLWNYLDENSLIYWCD